MAGRQSTSRSSGARASPDERAVLRRQIAHEHGAAARDDAEVLPRRIRVVERRDRSEERARSRRDARLAPGRATAPGRAPRRRGPSACGPCPWPPSPARPARAPGRAWPRPRRGSPGSGRSAARATTRPTRTVSPERTRREVRGAIRTAPTKVPLVLPSSTSDEVAALTAKGRVPMADAGVGQAHVAAGSRARSRRAGSRRTSSACLRRPRGER